MRRVLAADLKESPGGHVGFPAGQGAHVDGSAGKMHDLTSMCSAGPLKVEPDLDLHHPDTHQLHAAKGQRHKRGPTVPVLDVS